MSDLHGIFCGKRDTRQKLGTSLINQYLVYPPIGTMPSLSIQTNGYLDTALVDMFARSILISGFLRSLLT